MRNILRSIITPLLEFIYPPRCAFCDAHLGEARARVMWCAVCDRALRHIEADFAAPRLKRVWFDRARSICPYEGRVKDAVHGFKYAQRFDLVRVFAQLMQEEVARCGAADTMMPVPLHPRRLRARGYNQSALLARSLARRCSLRFDGHTLMRVLNTAPQVDRELSQRLTAMRDAFAVRNTSRVRDKRIVVIDDVLTTGATVNECARVLKKAGAARVDVVTIARVL